MKHVDLILLHPPVTYRFRELPILHGPVNVAVHFQYCLLFAINFYFILQKKYQIDSVCIFADNGFPQLFIIL